MANSVIVTGPCKVSTGGHPAVQYTGGETIQPDSPYYLPLLWSNLATDSGQPAIPSGPPAVYPTELVLQQSGMQDNWSIRWRSGQWEVYDQPGAFVPVAPVPRPSSMPAFAILPQPTIRRLGGGRFHVDLSFLEALKPAAGVTYYVAPGATGTGTSAADPAKVSDAIDKSDVGTIVYAPGEYRRETSTITASITKSLRHIAAGPGVRVTGWNAALVWTLVSGNIYQTSRSATLGVVDILNRTSWSDFTVYTKKADLASISGPGQWAIVGSTVYVWAIGNTNLTNTTNADAQLRVQVNSRNGINAVAGTTQYVKGIDFEGCPNGGLTASAGARIVAEDCTSRYAAVGQGGGNGVNITNAFGVFVRCEMSSNELDGFNYHEGVGYGGEFLEIDCRSHHNGLNTPGTNNGSTSHETVKGIRVGGVYGLSGGPVLADVNSAKTWNLGCTAGGSSVTNSGSYGCDAAGFESDPAEMWLDECKADGADYVFRTYTGPSKIHVHGLVASSLKGTRYPTDTGTVDYYTPAD